MRLSIRRSLNEHGVAHHFILPIVAVLAVASIGAYTLHAIHAAASNYYSATCATKDTYANGANGGSCVKSAQELLDGLQHAKYKVNGKLFVTTTKVAANQTFAYGKSGGDYLIFNGIYNGATQGAITTFTGDKTVSTLNAGTASNDDWQILCTDIAKSGIQLKANKNSGPLAFTGTSYTMGTTTMVTAFATACGTVKTVSTGTGSTGSTGSTGTGSSGSGSTGTGFITTSGTELMQNGKQYKSIGFNFSAVGDCWSGTNWTTAQMDTFFAALPSDSLARFFAPPDGTDSAAYVESVVKEADKYNIHLIVALADDDVDNNCDTENASNNGRTAAYYTAAPVSGSTYYNWVQSVVKPLANDPGVAMWEISNEPAHAGVNLYDGQLTQATFNAYVKNSAADIKAAEVAGAGSAKQLITIAPADLGDIDGGNESNAQTVFSYVDVVDDHDYSADADAGSPPVNTDFATEEQVAKALNKPFMVDEAGVEGGTSCNGTPYNAWDNGSGGLSLPNRVTFLVTDKATDYFKNGASSINFWLYTGTAGGCSYENIYTGDPIMAAVKSYKYPS